MNRADIETRAALNPDWARSVHDQLRGYRLAMINYWTTRIDALPLDKKPAAQKQLAVVQVPTEAEAILAEILERPSE